MIIAPPDALVGFTIYEKPIDFPDKFVVRKWVVVPGHPHPINDPDCALAWSIEEARALVPDGLNRIPRYPDDDPKIVEVWM